MKKVLLIGGAGYVGSVVTDSLLNEGYSVRVLDNFIYQNQRSVIPYFTKKNYEFVYGDFSNSKTISNVLKDVSDVVILGGLVGDPITKKYPEESNLINNIGIKNCIDSLNQQGLDKVVFISTCSNYGLIEGDILADENFELKPLSLYAKAKVEAEQYLLSLKGKVDYSPVILRFATAFGLSSRMRFDLTVSEFTRDLAFGKELLVFDAHTWRPYCHVNDFARLIDLVFKASKDKVAFDVFNAGGEINNFTKQKIVDTILKYLPNSKVKYQEHGADPRNYRVNFDKVKAVLGFEPKYTVDDGVRELLNAIQVHLFDNSEKERNFHGNYEIQYKRQ